MRQLKVIIEDIKRGENLDIYVTILLSIAVAFLGILQVTSLEIISSAMLTAIALLASSLLTNRRTTDGVKNATQELIQELHQKISSQGHISNVFSRAYPDLTKQFQSARCISILALTLQSTVSRYYSQFIEVLKRGGELRVLTVEPTPEVLSMQIYRSASVKDENSIVNMLHGNVAMLETLTNYSSEPELMQIRTMPYLPPYGLVIIEHHDKTSTVYVKLLTFQKADAEQPSFEVDSENDADWNKFFKDQFNSLWKAAEQK